MTTGHFLEEFLKKKGFDEKIIQHIKPYNTEKQIKKIKELSKNEIKKINNVLLKIENEEYIFPLFYSLICKINIERIANYINFSSDREPKKNKHIYYCDCETMKNAMDSLTSEFNTDSIILIIELIDEELCKISSLRDEKDKFKIDEINETTLQIIKKITSSEKKYESISSLVIKELEKRIDKPYLNLLIDIHADITMIQDIEKLYSFNSLTNEKICILNTDIEKVIRRYRKTDMIKHIINKFETIQQIGWKRFVSIDFTKFCNLELKFIMKHLTVENFHHLLNYDEDFNKLLFYLITNDDNLANQAIKYLPSLIEGIKLAYDDLSIYKLEEEILNFVELYKNSKPFDFLFKPYLLETKNILTELILREYPYELVTNENFIKRIENLHRNMWENQNCSIIIYIKEGIYYDLNIFLYGDTHKEIEKEIDILKKRYTPSNTNIERIETLIGRYLRLKQDIKRKKELLTYLTTAKTRKRKIILYSIVIDLMNSINKKSKSLFYLAFEKNVGCSLIETKMINEFKQFLSL